MGIFAEMDVVSLEQRLEAISELFCQAYFGHVLTSKAIWNQVEAYCDSYVAACENLALKTKTSGAKAIAKGAEKIFDEVAEIINNHRLNLFPVCPRHKLRVIHWLAKLL